MVSYIKSLLPRLKRYSQDLDTTEAFIDKPWVLVDDKENVHEYFFQREGKLTSSINGRVVEGTWALIGGGERLLIDNGQNEKTLYQHLLTIEGLFALRRSGGAEEPFLLYNRKVIPDGDIAKYLREYLRQRDVVVGSDGKFFTGTIDSEEDSTLKYEAEDGEVVNRFYVKTYVTKTGVIVVRQKGSQYPQIGDTIEEKTLYPGFRYSPVLTKYELLNWKTGGDRCPKYVYVFGSSITKLYTKQDYSYKVSCILLVVILLFLAAAGIMANFIHT